MFGSLPFSNQDIYAFVMLLFIFWKCHCLRYFRFQYRLTVGGTVSRGKPALNCFLVCIYIVYYILYSMYCIFSSKLTFKYWILTSGRGGEGILDKILKNSSFSSGDRPLLVKVAKWAVRGWKEEESERIKVREAAFAPVKSIFSCRKELFWKSLFELCVVKENAKIVWALSRHCFI